MCDENTMPIYGVKMGELLYDAVAGEGRIVLSNDFAFQHDVIQKDVLVDWKALLENLYNDLCYVLEDEEHGV